MDSVGVISLGLQVCQGLVRYYGSWKDCPKDVAATLESLSGLEKTFNVLGTAIKNPALSQEIMLHAEQRIDSCWNGVKKLQKRLDKFGNAPDGRQSKISSYVQRTLYPFKESTLAKMREIVRDLLDNLDLALSALQIDVQLRSFDTLDTVSKQIKSVALTQTDNNRMKILDWLSLADDGAQHSDYISTRESGTGQWLLDSSEFREWLHGSHSTLYCKGIPGSGKTIMTAIVVDHLRNQYSRHSIGIAFLYCNYRRVETQKAVNLLASLLRQLAADCLSLPDSVTALYEQHSPCGTRPSLEEISKSLHSVAETFSRIIIIIDALDECRNDDGTRSLILSENRKLQSRFKTKLMATSRDIPEITQEFHGDLELEIRASDTDLNCYLDDQMIHLSKSVQRNEELKQKIKRGIIGSAEGMFLLAKLHMESLRDKRTEKLINRALQTLPKGSEALNESYDRVIERIDGQLPEDRKLAKKIISWITYARRPLTTRELQRAIAVEPETTELDETNFGDIEDMISVCAGLVTINRENNVVRLVHYTTQQYFDHVGMKWIPDAAEMIASTCLTYLSYDTFNGKLSRTDEEIKAELSNSSFLEYCAYSWAFHVREIQNKMKEPILSFLQDQPLLYFWSRVITIDQYEYGDVPGYVRFKREAYSHLFSKKFTPLHVASKYDLEVIVATLLLANKVDVNIPDYHLRTPLSLAANHGSENAVKVLLTHQNIDPNCKDINLRTPLSYAAQNGHEKIVRLLIAQANVEVDCKDVEKRTPFPLAATRGNETAVKPLMEQEEADVNSKDRFARTPCSCATRHETGFPILMMKLGDNLDIQDADERTPPSYTAKNGHVATGKLFWSRDDIEAESRHGDDQTPLCDAARYGHEDIVKISISGNGADANSQDFNGPPPLLMPAMLVFQTLAKSRIVRDDVDANSENYNGQTPLSWAAQFGHKTIVEILIARDDVDADSKDRDGRTPLSFAAMNNHKAIVEILIARDDVDADSKDRAGRTPLSWAAHNGRETVVNSLIVRDDVDASSRDFYGQTPLAFAAMNNHQVVVEILIARDDVDADSKDFYGRTPLSWAAENDCETVVKFLIARNDVDPDSKDSAGRTPLSWAAGNGSAKTVQLLIAQENVRADSRDAKGVSPLSHALMERRYGVRLRDQLNGQLSGGREDFDGVITLLQKSQKEDGHLQSV